MSTKESKQIVKAINRWVRRNRPFDGGMTFGVDWPTWRVVFPKMSVVYQHHAEIISGRQGHFMPPTF